MTRTSPNLRHVEPLLPSAGAPATVIGAAALTGSGSLTAAGARTVTGAATLTGAGSLTATATRTVVGATALTGTGVLAASGTIDTGTVVTPATGGGRVVWVEEFARPLRAPRLVTGAAHLRGQGTLTGTGYVRSS